MGCVFYRSEGSACCPELQFVWTFSRAVPMALQPRVRNSVFLNHRMFSSLELDLWCPNCDTCHVFSPVPDFPWHYLSVQRDFPCAVFVCLVFVFAVSKCGSWHCFRHFSLTCRCFGNFSSVYQFWAWPLECFQLPGILLGFVKVLCSGHLWKGWREADLDSAPSTRTWGFSPVVIGSCFLIF